MKIGVFVYKSMLFVRSNIMNSCYILYKNVNYINIKNITINTMIEENNVLKDSDILEKNRKLINDFEDHLNIQGYSQKTIDIYTLYIGLFSKYINKDLRKITNIDITNYLSYLKKEKQININSLSLILSCIKHFYKEFLKNNLLIDIKLPRKSKKIPSVLTLKEIKDLIDATKKIRNKLIIEFIFSTGVRVSECVNCKINNLNFDEFTGRVISGKGNKDRLIILSKKWVEKYKLYLKERKIDSEYLFCNSKGNKLSVDTIQKFLKESANLACINKSISPHTLRHSFATNLLESDVNIRYIQQLLGHANLNTTQIYTKVNTNKLKTIKNPLDSM
jgi:integrase/recombinase XerD